MSPSLATDRISLCFWLNIRFVVNSRGAFRSLLQSIYYLRKTVISPESQRCLCRDGVYNTNNIRYRACAVLQSRWAGHPICDPSRIIATWFFYCSLNPLHPQNRIYLQSDLSCLYKLNCNIFNHNDRVYFSLHRSTPAIHHFFWLVVIAGDGDGRQRNQPRDGAMTWASHVLQKICCIKIS